MKIKQLPPQLVSLVHHIALNEKGWWDKTIQRFIISTIWLSENCELNIDEIPKQLRTHFGIKLEQNKLDYQIQKLCSTNVLYQISKNTYKISEIEYKKFSENLKRYEDIEQGSKETFFKLVDTFKINIDKEKAWDSFNNDLLSPLIHEMGARTYELLSGRNTDVESHLRFQVYIQKFPKDIQLNIRSVIISFLNPKSIVTREYVLSKLNAYFSLEAGNLSSKAISVLSEATKKNLEFEVFVDTNFLFSILGLHEDEMNETATMLLDLIKDVSNRIKIKVQAAKITITETQDVLAYHSKLLQNLRLTSNLSRIASNSDLSGLAKKFIDICKKTGKVIKAEDYFSPFLNNLITILKPIGVNFYNENLDGYTTDQRVIDDVIERLDYEEQIYGPNPLNNNSQLTSAKNNKKKASEVKRKYNKTNLKTAKTYEKLLHDVVLWYFIKDKRPRLVESPIDAKKWIVTEDYRLLSFDKFKRRKGNDEKVPICLHPTTLIQMLQFWVPRTTEFEEAIMSSLRYPFLFHEFDKSSEKVTIKILETLSLYEDINTMPDETITHILMNDVLRNKIKKNNKVEDQVKLITELIVEANSKANGELSLAKTSLLEKNKELFGKDQEIITLSDKILSLNSQLNSKDEENLTLTRRVENIEIERQQERNYNIAKKEFDKAKKEYIEERWNDFPKHKWVFWKLLSAIIIGIIAILLINYFVALSSNRYKLFIPGGVFFLITLTISFINRDNCLSSFRYNFFRVKYKKMKVEEFTKEFLKQHKEPHPIQ